MRKADMDYTEQDWERDEKLRVSGPHDELECPDCGFSGDARWYGPRHHNDRHYRACKRCGFWQDTGDPPYRCWLAMHLCKDVKAAGKALGPKREGYRCGECGTEVTKDHRVPWPAG